MVSGDVAFSGLPDEYKLATEFITRLKKSLASSNPNVEIFVIVIPGNHDCDFRDESEMRRFIFESGGLRNVEGINEAVVRELTSAQNAFFQFSSQIESKSLTNNDEPINVGMERLYYERHFSVAGYRITFQCFNAAWMSQLHEPQGQMVFPIHLVKSSETDSDLVIKAFVIY